VLVRGARWLGPGVLALVAWVVCGWSGVGRAVDDVRGCAPVARVVSVTGAVQLQRVGQSGVSPVKLGTFLCQNDLLHTAPGSRAAVFISAETDRAQSPPVENEQ